MGDNTLHDRAVDKNMPRRAGHVEGAIRASEVVEACRELGVEVYKVEGVLQRGSLSLYLRSLITRKRVPRQVTW